MPCGSPPAARGCCWAATSSSPPASTGSSKIAQGETRAVINTHEAMTGDFTRNPDLEFPLADA